MVVKCKIFLYIIWIFKNPLLLPKEKCLHSNKYWFPDSFSCQFHSELICNITWKLFKGKTSTTAGSLAESIPGLLSHVYVVLKNGKILDANREAQSWKGKKLFLICNNPKITAFPEAKSQTLWLLTPVKRLSGASLKFRLNLCFQV